MASHALCAPRALALVLPSRLLSVLLRVGAGCLPEKDGKMLTISRAQLQTYARLFVGRRNDYALQQPSGRYRRAGRPLSYEALRLHLLGMHTLGTYVIDEQGTCRFAVFDADGDDGVSVLATLQQQLQAENIPSYLEASRRGCHLWVFLSRLLPASHLRRWLLPFCPVGIEFYPKQDEGAGYGSLIRLPLGVHQRSGRHYGFFTWSAADRRVLPIARSLSETLTWFSTIERAQVPQTIPTSSPSPNQVTDTDQPQSLAKTSVTVPTTLPHESIRAWCVSQDPFRIIGHYVRLDRYGLGCCPFGEHHSDGKDSHPSFRVYAPRTASASCWYCYVWQRGGTLFDFLCLWYGLDARELWHRILKGDTF